MIYIAYALCGSLFALWCSICLKEEGEVISWVALSFATILWPFYIMAAIIIKIMEYLNDRLIND